MWREVQLYSFSTWALVWMSRQLHALSALLLGKETLIPFERETEWAPEPGWRLRRRNFLDLCGVEP